MISERGERFLARTGAVFLACGFPGRFLMPDDIHPVAEATAIGLLLLGSGLVLLRCAIRGDAVAGVGVLLLPMLVLWAARAMDALALKRAIDVYTACAAGFAIRVLVRDAAMARAVRASFGAAAVVLALFGVAQTLYLKREIEGLAHAMSHSLTMTDLGRAFLASRRAAATFFSPNAFGGFLLLAGMPLLFAVAAKPRVAAIIVSIVGLGAFACAGSAGATLAGLLGAAVVGWRCARGRARTASLVALAALGLGAVGLVVAAESGTAASGKIRTLAERLDYHRAGWRLLRDTFPAGAGLEQTRALMPAAREGNEAFSRSLHDWWLQGLVEGGIAFVPVIIALVWAIGAALRRVARRGGAREASPPPRTPRWWWIALGIGTLHALALDQLVTVFPYGLAHRGVHALATTAVAALAAMLVVRVRLTSAAYDVGLVAGVLAFAIHGFSDFDVYIPGVMFAFAVTLALIAKPDAESLRATRAARIVTAIHAVVCMLAPCGVLLLAATREHVH